MSRFAISFDSPVGRLAIAEEADAIVAICWAANLDGEPTPLLCEAQRQLAAYFGGRVRGFDLPLAPSGSAFERRVWTAMRAIPYGETRRYGELAMELGSAPRAIGRACGRNPIPIVIPCHRVLARAGIGGYSGGAGLETKRALLALEAAPPPPREFVGRCDTQEVGGSLLQIRNPFANLIERE
jgi:methylated-DNA-[protein]-cysteine S-methyltransferase